MERTNHLNFHFKANFGSIRVQTIVNGYLQEYHISHPGYLILFDTMYNLNQKINDYSLECKFSCEMKKL